MVKIKILLIASEFAPGMLPYAAKIINVLSNDDRLNVHSIVVCSGKKSYRGIIDSNTVKYVDYPSNTFKKAIYKILPLRIIKEINAEKKNFKPDVIHFLTCDFSLGLYNLLSSKKNIYWTVHDLNLHPANFTIKDYKPYIERLYIRFWNLVMFKIIPNLTTSSRKQYEDMKIMYPKAHCFYTHFPSLVTKIIARGDLAVAELEKIGEYLLFFGHTGYYKGTDLLVSAYSQSKQSVPLVIAGRGICDTKMNKNIIHLNRYIKDEEIATLFKKAVGVIYPYRDTTMSGVTSLALYFRKTVLASSTPFFLEQKVDGIIYFEVGNERDLVEKLNLLMDSRNEIPQIFNRSYELIYSDYILANDYYRMYNPQ